MPEFTLLEKFLNENFRPIVNKDCISETVCCKRFKKNTLIQIKKFQFI